MSKSMSTIGHTVEPSIVVIQGTNILWSLQTDGKSFCSTTGTRVVSIVERWLP